MQNNPQRILLVFSTMNRGGAEAMTMNLYRNIDRSKIQFDFVVHTTEKCDFDKEIELLGGKIFRVPRLNLFNILSYSKWWKDFFSVHDEYKILHAHFALFGKIFLKIAKERNITTIAHSHSSDVGTKGLGGFVKHLLLDNIDKYSDYIFACSEDAKYQFKIKKTNKIKIMNNAIDTRLYQFEQKIRIIKREELKLKDAFVIGHVGSFAPVKNQKFLIDLLPQIKARKSNVKLLLIGRGSLLEKLKEYATKKNLKEDIIFLGVRSDINELLQAMDIFAFPSLFEGLPVALVEAQTSGLKTVISNKVPEEVILTDLVSVRNLDDQKGWIESLTVEPSDKREHFAEIIKEKSYDIKSAAKWLEEFYANCDKEKNND